MIIERRISDAEKELDTIRTTIPSTELAKGFLKALEGLLLTAKSNNDKYLYMSKIERTPRNVKALRKEFDAHITNRLHADYDVGYFQALESYAKKLEHSTPSEQQVGPENDDHKN
jgi:hypothetical protein